MLEYPNPPPDLHGRFSWRVLRYFGAGAIIASVTIGSGESLFASRGGAIFGYSLLWCFVGGALMKGIQVYSAARYMTLTGAHPMAHWAYLPGPRNWVPLSIGVLSVLCFPFWLAGLPRILGEIVNWMVGVSAENDQRFVLFARLWGTGAILVAVTLTWVSAYSVMEKAQTAIMAILLASILAACLVAKPDWLLAIAGATVPIIPHYDDWVFRKYPEIVARPPWIEVLTYLGAIGGGTYDYIGYLGCLREKKWGAIGQPGGDDPTGAEKKLGIDCGRENLERARRWLVAPKVDTGVSFLCVLLFSLCFALLGAAILNPAQEVPADRDLLTHQAGFLTALHPSLSYVYQIGIFFAFWGTMYGAYEIYTRTAYECFAPLSRRLRETPLRSFRFGVLLYSGIGGLTLLWTIDDPIALVTPAALVGGVFTCGLWCFAMIWTDRKFLPKPLRMGPGLSIATALSGIVLTLLGIKGLWDYVAGWLA